MNNKTDNSTQEISYAKLGLTVFMAMFFSILLAGGVLGLIFERGSGGQAIQPATVVVQDVPPARIETPAARIIRDGGDGTAAEDEGRPTENLSEQPPVTEEPELPRVVVDDKSEAERQANAKRINIKTCNDWVRRYNVESSSYNREMRNSSCERAGISIESGD